MWSAHTYLNRKPKLTLHVDALPLLAFTNLKHDLNTDKQGATSTNKESPSTKTADDVADHSFQTIYTDGESDKVGRHHHEDVSSGANTTNPAVDIRTVLPFPSWEQKCADDLRQNEQCDQPTPDEKLEVDIVPECNKSKDGEEVADSAYFALPTATNRNVNVSDDPAVKTSVPASPES
jgi:hypothetical protein